MTTAEIRVRAVGLLRYPAKNARTNPINHATVSHSHAGTSGSRSELAAGEIAVMGLYGEMIMSDMAAVMTLTAATGYCMDQWITPAGPVCSHSTESGQGVRRWCGRAAR